MVELLENAFVYVLIVNNNIHRQLLHLHLDSKIQGELETLLGTFDYIVIPNERVICE